MRHGFGREALLICALALLACGGESRPPKDGPGPGPVAAEEGALGLVSAPSRSALTGTPFRYRVQLTKPGQAVWTLVQGPAGASIDEAGVLRWTPGAGDGGRQSFELEAKLGDETVRQRFHVDVATLTVESALSLSPTDPNGATLSVGAPLSPVRGSALIVPPGALEGTAPVPLSISAVTGAPIPLAAALSGLSAADLTVVDFGPSGQVFQQPVLIQLPVSQAVLAKGTPQVQSFDFESGRWERLPVLAVDAANGVVVAETTHFSLKAVTPEASVLALQPRLGDAACPERLEVTASLAVPFSSLPAETVNGYAGTAATVSDLLSQLGAGQSLKVHTTVEAVPRDFSSPARDFWLASATRLADGNFAVSVLTGGHPEPFLGIPAAVPLDEVEPWLSGARVRLRYPSLASVMQSGVSLAAEVSMYVGTAASANLPPLDHGVLVGPQERLDAPSLSTGTEDRDCDGAPDAFDPEPDGALPPALALTPAGGQMLSLGRTVSLSASTDPDATLSWEVSAPSVALAVSPDGRTAVVTPSTVGVFSVRVSATRGGAVTRAQVELVVDPPAALNTAPRVSITASPSTVLRAGELLRLEAVAFDPEQPAGLSYRWSAPPGALLSNSDGRFTSFYAASAGEYVFHVAVSDGQLTSHAEIAVTVLQADLNRAPLPPVVSPSSATLEHPAGVAATVTLTSWAQDPDGEQVSVRFVPAPHNPAGFTLTVQGSTATFSATVDGSYELYASAVDARGLEGPWTLVRLHVIPPLPPTPTDADKDGFPSGMDCDDLNPSIRPGAKEICGDGIDQDCSGADLPSSECDLDGDRFTVSGGDCDDTHPSRFPGAAERCDGVDNDCDGQTDEGFGLSETCSVGAGACSGTGVRVCGANAVGTVCNAQAGVPKEESCNGVDDDCDGVVDDVTQSGGNDVNNCGGCQVVCPSYPNAAPACANGGCSYACAAGTRDLNGVVQDGCECVLNPETGGAEVCNGRDDDCDGLVDENLTQTFYSGPAGSAGVGACAPGLRSCIAGTMTVTREERTPSAEACDGTDNDCDGTADEGYAFASDEQNCGGCGIRCAANQTCQQFACVNESPGTDGGTTHPPDAGVTCAPETTLCNGVCTSTLSDPNHCGGCGNTCASGFCSNGACSPGPTSDGGSPSCPPDMVVCGGQCVNPYWDSNHCGGCFKPCAAGTACNAGLCQSAQGGTDGGAGIDCGPGGLACDGMCVDRLNDPNHCGGCGNTCASGFCSNGACSPGPTSDGGSPSCPPDMVVCGGQCVNPYWDSNHCGGCFKPCAAGTACNSGLCQSAQGGTDGGGGGGTPAPDAGMDCQPGETRPCYSGPASTANVGVCQGGLQSCAPHGQWEAFCQGERLPAPSDRCDGLDDDCDGLVDEESCPLGLAPGAVFLLPGTSVSFTATGGTAPYSWTLSTNESGGSLSPSGLYTAGPQPGEDIILVTDATGTTAQTPASVRTTPIVTLSPGGGSFRDALLRVRVQTVIGATLSATLDGMPRSYPPVGADGTVLWEVELGSPGPHELGVTASVGAQSASATATYVLDATPPPPPSITSPSGGDVASPLTLRGFSEPDSFVDILSLHEPAPLGTALTQADGGFELVTPQLPVGEHAFFGRASDLAGNTSPDSAVVRVRVTTGTPGPLTPKPAFASLTAGQSMQFLATGGTTSYTWSVVSNGSGGALSPDGLYTAGGTPGADVIRVSDGISTVDVQVNVQAPLSVSIQSPMPGSVVSSIPFPVSGVTSPFANIEIELDGQIVNGTQAGPSGSFEQFIDAPNGLHTLRVRAVAGPTQDTWSSAVSFTVCVGPSGCP